MGTVFIEILSRMVFHELAAVFVKDQDFRHQQVGAGILLDVAIVTNHIGFLKLPAMAVGAFPGRALSIVGIAAITQLRECGFTKWIVWTVMNNGVVVVTAASRQKAR